MKKITIFALALIFTQVAFSQFYVGLSGGYSLGSTPRVNGTEVKLNGSTLETTNIYGSYGQGVSGNLKLGYFFNEHVGAEVDFGYLHGAEQTKGDVNIPSAGKETDATAATRMYRTTISLVYRINSGFYGKFGALIPLGGKTVVKTDDRRIVQVPVGQNPETGAPIMAPANVHTNYEMNLHGSVTLGFAGALGYEFNFSDHFSAFAEIEYMGLAIKSNDSEYVKYNQEMNIHLPPELGGIIITKETTLEDLGEGKYIDYVDTIKVPGDNWVDGDNYDKTKRGVDFKQSAPYDSFGLNIGIKYSFGK